MTDLNAESELLPLQPVREEWKGHKVFKFYWLVQRFLVFGPEVHVKPMVGPNIFVKPIVGPNIFGPTIGWSKDYNETNVCRAWSRPPSTSTENSSKRVCWKRLSIGGRTGYGEYRDTEDF